MLHPWDSEELGECFNLFGQYVEEEWCLIVFEEFTTLLIFLYFYIFVYILYFFI